MSNEIDRNQIRDIIRRRKKSFLTIFLLLFFSGLVVALALPPIYKSEVLIRIDDQEIPEGFAQSTMSDYVEQRIGKIKQRVLSRPRLREVIKELNLYPLNDDQSKASAILEEFRENINMETIVSEMQSKPGGKALSFTLAFILSYEGKEPETVQKVTNKLGDLYIEEDLKRKKDMMAATTEFLKAEQERLKNEIDRQEKIIGDFKKNHLRELPTEARGNIQMVARLERELDKANLTLKSLNEKLVYLKSELAMTEPLSPIVIEGDKIASNPNQRLKELRIELTKMRSIYSEKHPDIKKIKREIKVLETKVNSSDHTVKSIKRLEYLESQLVSKESESGPKHPEVIKIKKEIAALSKEINNQVSGSTKKKITEQNPDNPVYINLATQINALEMEIRAVRKDEEKILQSIAEYQRRIETAPAVENELNALTRDYEASKEKYKEILNELMSAEVATNVEGMQRGQRFIIASPAYLPAKPFKPNRFAIIVVGFILALGTGFIIAAFQESMDDSVKSTDQIRQIVDAPVLSSISYIVTDREKRTKRLRNFIVAVFLIAGLCLGLYFLNQYVIKIEYLFSVILERIKMIV